MRVAIIGAGVAGLRLARLLDADGADVEVFDKARGPSGRLSTRRSREGSFDHGAQYFTARHPSFVKQVEDWCERGVVERWEARVAYLDGGQVEIESDAPERYVGLPRMSAIGRDLETGLSTKFSTRIQAIKKEGGTHTLEVESGDELKGYDLVISAAPAPQAVPLLAASPQLAARAEEVRMQACHALMVQFDAGLDVDVDAAFVRSNVMAWAAHNDSKPGREGKPNWILHSTPDWSAAHLEASPNEIRDALLGAFSSGLGQPLPNVRFFSAHRWLYSRPDHVASGAPLWDPERGLGACGDWVHGDRVEDAYLSAEILAEAIRAR